MNLLESIVNIPLSCCMLVMLIFAAISDIKSRYVSPKIQLMILAFGVVKAAFLIYLGEGYEVAAMVIFGVVMFAVYLTVAVKFGGIGGADTKVMSALAFYLGTDSFIFCLLVVTSVFAYAAIVRAKTRVRVRSIPLMPFLAADFFVAQLICEITKNIY